jgi:hypothetical protein
MSGNIMIRKAKNNYVCECCGHIIKAGTEYLDKVILNNGKCVQHDRYHDVCPKTSLPQVLFDKLDRADGDLPAAYNGEKIHIIGIAFNNKGPVILYREWLGTAKLAVPFSEVSAMVDADGNALV